MTRVSYFTQGGSTLHRPDGKTIHLGGRYIERTKDGLSELKSLDSPFGDIRIMRSREVPELN